MSNTKTFQLARFMTHKVYLVLATVVLVVALVLSAQPGQVLGTSAAELRAKADELAAQQAANEAILESLEQKTLTLQDELRYLEVQIDQINSAIQSTTIEIQRLEIELAEAEAELQRQKGLLADNLRTLYIEGNVSTLDLILASEGFSDFVNNQEYLTALKNSIQDSTNRVTDLKTSIEENKKSQEDLLSKQEAQRQDLDDRKDEQQSLLDRTRGQESLYQQIVTDLERARQQAEEELEEFLAAQNFVSLGEVDAGDVIGRMGTTGFSTGVHLHFAVYKNGTTVNPYLGGTTLIDGFLWPTENSTVTQLYGCGAPYYWYAVKCNDGTSKHTGLDIGPIVPGVSGDLVFAAADGDIVLREYSGGFGNLVVIDHGGGVLTYYGHLQD